MKQKTVLISGIIGLVFGFLFSGTLGISFFDSNDIDNQESRTALKKDEEGFRLAYNLEESIYVPIYGDDYYEKLENKETFILYIGRDTCPYCQQHVPNLMEAAIKMDINSIFHVDTIDPNNKMFVDEEVVRSTPTTYIVKDGVVVETIIGYRSASDLEDILNEILS
jgi:predicted bacteriocin transport accessory protein